jgi:hypothetical protein
MYDGTTRCRTVEKGRHCLIQGKTLAEEIISSTKVTQLIAHGENGGQDTAVGTGVNLQLTLEYMDYDGADHT